VSRKGWLLFIALGVIWGMPYLLIKIGVEGLTPASLVLARTVIGSAILLPLALYRREVRGLLPQWRAVLVFASVEVIVPWVLLASAEQRLSSSLAGLLIACVPLVATLINRLTGGEPLGWRRLTGLGIGLAGVAALVGLDLTVGDTWALVLISVVVVGYALGPWILHRHLSEQSGLGVMAVSLTVCALVYAPVGIAQWPSRMPSVRVLGAVVLLGVICTALALLVFSALIAEVGPVRSTVITYINPAVAIILGIVFLGEPFTAGIGLGFALVLAGSILATRRSPEPAPEPVTTPAR
jgi:drug/metabolite transporter (DMT)-like permease